MTISYNCNMFRISCICANARRSA